MLNYTGVNYLGSGAFGVVFTCAVPDNPAARKKVDNQQAVAVKVVLGSYSDVKGEYSRSYNECRLCDDAVEYSRRVPDAILKHHYKAVNISDTVRDQTVSFVVMSLGVDVVAEHSRGSFARIPVPKILISDEQVPPPGLLNVTPLSDTDLKHFMWDKPHEAQYWFPNVVHDL